MSRTEIAIIIFLIILFIFLLVSVSYAIKTYNLVSEIYVDLGAAGLAASAIHSNKAEYLANISSRRNKVKSGIQGLISDVKSVINPPDDTTS